jgi:hypothetical protein
MRTQIKIDWLSRTGAIVAALMLLEGGLYFFGFTYSVSKVGIVMYGLASTFWGKPFSLWSTKIATAIVKPERTGRTVYVPALDTVKGATQILMMVATTLLLFLIISALKLTAIGQYIPS